MSQVQKNSSVAPPVVLELQHEADTLALGRRLGEAALPGAVVHLHGDLGAGKTTLVRGMLRGLGFTGRVKSPTYTLVELYPFLKLSFYHFDFYRFEHPEEWLDAGFREYFNEDSLCVVEWPEKAGRELPSPDLEVTLEATEEGGRRARLEARTEAGSAWLARVFGEKSPP